MELYLIGAKIRLIAGAKVITGHGASRLAQGIILIEI